METQKKLGVYQAILEVAAEISVGGIAKDKQAKRDNGGVMYNFRGIDDIYNALSPILAKHKLVILPKVLSRDVIERASKSGSALFFVTVEVEYELVSATDGSSHSIKTYGEAQDSGDKATNKALSAAYKYMAIQVFCIPVEGQEDGDNDTETDLTPTAPNGGKVPAPADPLDMIIPADKALTLETMIKDAKLDAGRLLKFYKVERLDQLTERLYLHAVEQVEKASKKATKPTPLSAAAEAAANGGKK